MRVTECKLDGQSLRLTLSADSLTEAKRFALHFSPGEYQIHRTQKKRSLDANAMLWRMCGLVAAAVGESKDDVYRKAIREAGVYSVVEVAPEAVYDFCRAWNAHGVGWFAEVADDAPDGRKLVIAYHGSSTYDTRQMARLIDSVLQDAAAVGVETLSERERTLLLDEWNSE